MATADLTTSQTCNRCGIRKPLDQFYRNKKRQSGRDPGCIDCKKQKYAADQAAKRAVIVVPPEPVAPGVTFKTIDGFPRYRVGDDGSVWSKPRPSPRIDPSWKRLKPGGGRLGHLCVGLYRDDGPRRNATVHELILEAFVGPRPPGAEGCHFPDRDPSNNKPSNLLWDTPKANQAHRVIHGTDMASWFKLSSAPVQGNVRKKKDSRVADSPHGDVTSRVCNRCKVRKSLDLFYRNKNYPLGREVACKDCWKQKYVEDQATRRSSVVIQPEPISPGVTFKCVEGFPRYRVGDDGSVWSLPPITWRKHPTWKRLSPGRGKTGHLHVALFRGDGTFEQFSVHELVLTAFKGPRPPGMEGCHFPDRNPSNNTPGNLRWDTPLGNQGDRVFHGTYVRGETSYSAKLTEADVREIRELRKTGLSYPAIASRFGVGAACVAAVVYRKNWKHIE